MNRYRFFLICFYSFYSSVGSAQPMKMIDTIPRKVIQGYHVGIVQPILAINRNDIKFLNDYNFYSIGFPFGITLKTSGRLLIDLELVPFIKPYFNDEATPYKIHLLYHPGVLMPVGNGFTVGLRAAFEPGNDQFGFTPLLNKGYKLGKGTQFFIELVFPGRFGPEKSSGYTQVAGVHLGLGF